MDIKRIDTAPYFLEVFTKRVKEDPEAKMLYDDRDIGGLTRHQVDEASARVYAWLSRKGIGKEDFVLICMPRGVWSIVSMIGVWKAGAALTVVEDNYAEERIAFIKQDCGCKAVIDMDAWQEINEEEPKEGYRQADLHDAAFAVYTSGSSGTPKGVLHEYGNIKLNVLSAKSPTGPRTNSDSRIALIAPLNFVAATKTVLGLLYGVYRLYVIPYSISKNPLKLKKYYRDAKITNTFLSPSIIRATGGDISPYLKVVHTGSEPANGIFLEGVELVNNYSMSEGAFTLCQFVMDRPYDVCPVGKPNYDEIKICLLDQDEKEAPKGESGEICFENPFFRGYINMPDATKEALRGGLYHTGDLGKWDENGNLVLLGRANDMIKINGNRIEPAEIEAAFKAVTGKDWCAARGFEKPEQSFIALYYQGKLEMDEKALRDEMGTRLPYYMIPAYFVAIEGEIPLLPNGKLNRKALPEPERHYEQEEYVAPVTKTQAILCRAFEKVLHLDRVGIHDNFYHLGGDSLGAMSVLVEAGLDELSAIDIFEGTTPERIAEIYDEKLKELGDSDMEVVELRERLKAQHPTANQINLIDYTLYNAKRISVNLPLLYSFPKEVDADRLCRAYQAVLEAHPIFATVFEFDENCDLVERFVPDRCPTIQVTDLTEEEMSAKRDTLVQIFHIIGEPLVRGGIYRTEEHVYLFLDMHHAVTDGSAYQIFFRDLVKAYRGEALELDTYYSYLAREERLKGSEKYENARKYYAETYEDKTWCMNLRPNIAARATGVAFLQLPTIISQEQMAMFEDRSCVSRNTFAVAMCLLTIAKIERENNVMLNWVFHDRTDKVKQNAFGCIYRNIPVGLQLKHMTTLGEVFDAIQARSNESIANSCYEWSILNDNTFVNDMMMLVYETSTIMSSGGLKDLGAKSESIDEHRDSAIRSVAVQIVDSPQAIVTILAFASSIFTPEKRNLAVSEMDRIVRRILEADNPSSLSVKEMLS